MVAAAVPVHRCVQILQVPNHSTKDFAPDHPILSELVLQHRTFDFDLSGDIMLDPKPAHRMSQIYSTSIPLFLFGYYCTITFATQHLTYA